MPALTQPPHKFWKRRYRSNYFTTLVSMTLVLMLAGIVIAGGVLGGGYIRYLRQSLPVKLMLFDETPETRLAEYRSRLKEDKAVRKAVFISKDEAAAQYLERTGEDVLLLTGGINPLPAGFDLHLKTNSINPDSLRAFREKWAGQPYVSEVYVPAALLMDLERNLFWFQAGGLILGLLLALLSLFLILGTIRLSIYAQRISIRTMELIGARHWFIRRPFLWRGLGQGGLAGMLAGGLVAILLWGVNRFLQTPVNNPENMPQTYIGIFLGIALIGLVLGVLGSFLAVNRYLNRNLDDLV